MGICLARTVAAAAAVAVAVEFGRERLREGRERGIVCRPLRVNDRQRISTKKKIGTKRTINNYSLIINSTKHAQCTLRSNLATSFGCSDKPGLVCASYVCTGSDPSFLSAYVELSPGTALETMDPTTGTM